MEAEKIIINATSGEPVTILTGEYKHPKEPLKLAYSGTISTVSEFIVKRKDQFNWLFAACKIDRENMNIVLTVDEKDSENISVISGKIQVHPDFKKWKINTGESIDPLDLSDFIKMNRSCFIDKETAMKLFAQLRDFKATIEGSATQIVKSDNSAYEIARRKAINHNLPPQFTLNVPVFKGEKPQQFTVEINVNPDTLKCVLISPDANDLINDFKNIVIDKEKDLISSLVPELVIYEC